jgi:hypothetical protein
MSAFVMDIISLVLKRSFVVKGKPVLVKIQGFGHLGEKEKISHQRKKKKKQKILELVDFSQYILPMYCGIVFVERIIIIVLRRLPYRAGSHAV